MLVVTVEVWPGGDILRRQVIGTMNLANVSNLEEISNYKGYIDDRPVSLTGHKRSDGAWELIRKVLNERR